MNSLRYYGSALLGLVLLIGGVMAVRYNYRVTKTAHCPASWWRWYVAVYVLGLCCAATVPFQHFPLGGGVMFDLPFFAIYFDDHGRDFFGILTLPSLIVNAVVWFLVPQLVLAWMLRRRERSIADRHAALA